MNEPWLLEAVTEVARLGGGIAGRHFRSLLVVETKLDGSPVTIADRGAERAMRDWIGARFPNDDIVGEELDNVARGAARRWIIDPIDGTRSFVAGVPLWGTLVAVAEGDEVVAGAAYFPSLSEMLCAAPGAGCWWNGVRSRVSETSTLAHAVVLTSDEQCPGAPERAPHWRRLASAAQVSRTWGDCYGYCLVATGRAEVMVDASLEMWDAAALMPAVIEAGGRFTDWNGCVTAFGGSAVATNARLADEARRVLAAP